MLKFPKTKFRKLFLEARPQGVHLLITKCYSVQSF